jgi:hypothetical protein
MRSEQPRERFRVSGITYEPAERTKSDLYRDVLPLIALLQQQLVLEPPWNAAPLAPGRIRSIIRLAAVTKWRMPRLACWCWPASG